MESTAAQLFQLHENALQFRQMDTGQVDGVKLNDDEKEYLLPHFLMLLVGKPGSGKTTLLKQLMTNQQMYYRKFDDVFLVSPSHAKMGIKIKPDNTRADFSLDWLFKKFEEINEEQMETIFGNRATRSVKDKKQANQKNPMAAQGLILNDNKSRFLLSDAFMGTTAKQIDPKKAGAGDMNAQQQKAYDDQLYMQTKYEELKQMPRSQQEKTHRNILVVLDDVVGQVKKAEFDPRLSQLVMNRRHLIFNGTISLIFVTQKYTLIPARIRSNANWLVLYQLNPLDFELAYRDCVTLSVHVWRQLLMFVYGIDLTSKPVMKSKQVDPEEKENIDPEQEMEVETKKEEKAEEPKKRITDDLKAKKFENLGIWVEANMYFKNFKRIAL